MADKSLKSISFPGLSDKYTVPEVDSTLTKAGGAADAKVVGGEISAINYGIDATKNVIGIEGLLEYGSLSSVTLSFQDNGRRGTIGEKIKLRESSNYSYCVVTKETPFYKVSTYTVTSSYYPFYILGVDETNTIVYQNADNSVNGQREFYIYLPENVVEFYVTGSKNGNIQVWKVEPTTVPDILSSNYEKQNIILQEAEINALESIITYNRTTRFLNFGFITDTHSNDRYADESIQRLKRISKAGILDAIFHGGDVLSTEINSTPLSMSEYFEAELGAINDYTSIDNLMFIQGNHDNGHNRDTVNDLSSQQYSLLFGNSLSGLTKNPNEWWKSYGYIDYSNMKVRLIILESFAITGEEATSAIQDSWLENTALNIPSEDWTTVVLMHYIADDNYYTSTINILQSFAALHNLAAVICGHRHYDAYSNALGFNLINVTAGFYGFDCFTLDTVNNVLYETRIGTGDSRSYHFGTNANDNYQITT